MSTPNAFPTSEINLKIIKKAYLAPWDIYVHLFNVMFDILRELASIIFSSKLISFLFHGVAKYS